MVSSACVNSVTGAFPGIQILPFDGARDFPGGRWYCMLICFPSSKVQAEVASASGADCAAADIGNRKVRHSRILPMAAFSKRIRPPYLTALPPTSVLHVYQVKSVCRRSRSRCGTVARFEDPCEVG